jgi:hypothetical protein
MALVHNARDVDGCELPGYGHYFFDDHDSSPSSRGPSRSARNPLLSGSDLVSAIGVNGQPDHRKNFDRAARWPRTIGDCLNSRQTVIRAIHSQKDIHDLVHFLCAASTHYISSSARVERNCSTRSRETIPSSRPFETTGNWLTSARPNISSASAAGISGLMVFSRSIGTIAS